MSNFMEIILSMSFIFTKFLHQRKWRRTKIINIAYYKIYFLYSFEKGLKTIKIK